MAGSVFGTIFKISTWGESHGKGIGVVIDGCPAGIPLCEEDIQVYLDRRKPGQNKYTTARSESDAVEIMSGVFEGLTTGTLSSSITKTSVPKITVPSRSFTAPGMQILHTTRNTDSVIIVAEGVPQDGKPSGVSLPVQWHASFLQN